MVLITICAFGHYRIADVAVVVLIVVNASGESSTAKRTIMALIACCALAENLVANIALVILVFINAIA